MAPTIRLVPMSASTYAEWRRVSIADYADEHVLAKDWPAEGALALAEAEFTSLLPDGPATPDHFLRSIEDADSGRIVGHVWFLAGEGPRPGAPPRGFIYDLEIRPEHRRKGFAEAALRAVELEVSARGIDTVGLHVFAHNTGARALYDKIGYRPTNLILKKGLAPAGPPA